MAVRPVRACFFEMGETEAKLVGWQAGWSVGRESKGFFGWEDTGSGRRRGYALFCTRYDIPRFMKMEKKR